MRRMQRSGGLRDAGGSAPAPRAHSTLVSLESVAVLPAAHWDHTHEGDWQSSLHLTLPPARPAPPCSLGQFGAGSTGNTVLPPTVVRGLFSGSTVGGRKTWVEALGAKAPHPLSATPTHPHPWRVSRGGVAPTCCGLHPHAHMHPHARSTHMLLPLAGPHRGSLLSSPTWSPAANSTPLSAARMIMPSPPHPHRRLLPRLHLLLPHPHLLLPRLHLLLLPSHPPGGFDARKCPRVLINKTAKLNVAKTRKLQSASKARGRHQQEEKWLKGLDLNGTVAATREGKADRQRHQLQRLLAA